MTPPRWYVAFWSAIFAGYCAFWIGINMADTVVLNTQAGTNGKTLATLEGTAQSVTGGLVPASDAAIVGWVRRKSVTLTNAQVKALPTTAIAVLSAPGSGYWYNVLAVSYSANFAAAAYTNINTTYADLRVQYTGTNDFVGGYVVNDSAASPVLDHITNLFGNALAGLVPGVPYSEGFSLAGADPEYVVKSPTLWSVVNNVGLEVKMDNNGSGALTGGDAANTLKVTVYYIVEPL